MQVAVKPKMTIEKMHRMNIAATNGAQVSVFEKEVQLRCQAKRKLPTCSLRNQDVVTVRSSYLIPLH
jgi:hypothetical protein